MYTLRLNQRSQLGSHEQEWDIINQMPRRNPVLYPESTRALTEQIRMDNCSLNDYLDLFDDGDVAQAAYEIGQALQFIHSRNLIHRAIQPDSIVVTNACFMLTDFANAKLLNENGFTFCENPTDSEQDLNIYHDLVAIKHKRFSKNTDLCGLMCVLFFMNQKRHPLAGKAIDSVIKILEDGDIQNGRIVPFDSILEKSKFFKILKLLACGTSAEDFVSCPELEEFRKLFPENKLKELPELSHLPGTLNHERDMIISGADVLFHLNKASFYYDEKDISELKSNRKMAIPEPSAIPTSTSPKRTKKNLPNETTQGLIAKPAESMEILETISKQNRKMAKLFPRDKPRSMETPLPRGKLLPRVKPLQRVKRLATSQHLPRDTRVTSKNTMKVRPVKQSHQVLNQEPNVTYKKPRVAPRAVADKDKDAGTDREAKDDMIFACFICMEFISDNPQYMASHAVVCSHRNKGQFKAVT